MQVFFIFTNNTSLCCLCFSHSVQSLSPSTQCQHLTSPCQSILWENISCPHWQLRRPFCHQKDDILHLNNLLSLKWTECNTLHEMSFSSVIFAMAGVVKGTRKWIFVSRLFRFHPLFTKLQCRQCGCGLPNLWSIEIYFSLTIKSSFCWETLLIH